MKHVMLDLETLSTHPNAAVLSIGLAAFDDQNVVDTLELALDPKEIFGHISVDTVAWWMGQSDAARQRAFRGTVKQYDAAMLLKNFFRTHFDRSSELWANSPSFDVTIIENWWEGLIDRQLLPRGDRLPWTYRQPRDYRTLIGEGRQHGVPVDLIAKQHETGTAHCSVDDAAYQARVVIGIRKWLKLNLPKRDALPSAA